MDMMRGRRRRGRHGRQPLPVKIDLEPRVDAFTPEPNAYGERIQMELAELEALRLVDLDNLTQEEAGDMMGVSRGTIWRLLKRGRTKVVAALVEGRKLEIIQPENLKEHISATS
jgi:predicted DNA-binding protein (UPF0251 family)